jgi:FkbM family methyltransferase
MIMKILEKLRKNSIIRKIKILLYTILYRINGEGIFTQTVVLSNGVKIKADYDKIDMVGSTDSFEIDIMKKLLRPGFVCLDVGANVGAYALNMSTEIGKNGMVYAFEPSPETFKVLKENVKSSGLKNIVPHKYAVGDKNGEAILHVAFQSGLTGIGDTGRGTIVSKISVPMITLDNFVKKESIDRVDFLKIDVEGFEPAVLKGAQNMLTNSNMKVFTELDQTNTDSNGFDRQDIISWMSSLGYKAWGINRESRKVIPLTTNNQDMVMNVIFSKEDIKIN